MSAAAYSLLDLRDVLRLRSRGETYPDIERETKLSNSAAGRLCRGQTYTEITQLDELLEACSEDEEALKRAAQRVEELINDGETVASLLAEGDATAETPAGEAGGDEDEVIAVDDGIEVRRSPSGKLLALNNEAGDKAFHWDSDIRRYEFELPVLANAGFEKAVLSEDEVAEMYRLYGDKTKGGLRLNRSEAAKRMDAKFPVEEAEHRRFRFTATIFKEAAQALGLTHDSLAMPPHTTMNGHDDDEIVDELFSLKENRIAAKLQADETQWMKGRLETLLEERETREAFVRRVARENVDGIVELLERYSVPRHNQKITDPTPVSKLLAAADLHMCSKVVEGRLVGGGEEGNSCKQMFETIGPQVAQEVVDRYAGKNLAEFTLALGGDFLEALFGQMHPDQRFKICHTGDLQLKRAALWTIRFLIDPLLSVLPDGVKLRIVLVGGNHDRFSESAKADKVRTGAQVVAQMVWFALMGTEREKRVEWLHPKNEMGPNEASDSKPWFGLDVTGPDGRRHRVIVHHGDNRKYTPKKLIEKDQQATQTVYPWYTVLHWHLHKWELEGEQDGEWAHWGLPAITGPNEYASEELLKFGYRGLAEFTIDEDTILPWPEPIWLLSERQKEKWPRAEEEVGAAA